MKITQNWFCIDNKNWFLLNFKTFEQKCEELALSSLKKEEQEEQEELSEKMRLKIEEYLDDQATQVSSYYSEKFSNYKYVDDICDDAWERAYEDSKQELINYFDHIDDDYELIEFNKEDEQDLWQKEKSLIINYLKSL